MSENDKMGSVRGERVYLRVSTDEQDRQRQEGIVEATRSAGDYVASVYREKASGARADRPELLRMIADLQPGEVVVAEKIDRISRLPLAEAERLVAAIKVKGARLAVPGIVDLSDLVAGSSGVARIVLAAVQEMVLPERRKRYWILSTSICDAAAGSFDKKHQHRAFSPVARSTIDVYVDKRINAYEVTVCRMM